MNAARRGWVSAEATGIGPRGFRGVEATLPTVRSGAIVEIHFTMRLTDGRLVKTSRGNRALRYVQGAGQLLPGVERALEGRQVGDKFRVTVPPEEGYSLVKSQIVRIPRDELPASTCVTPGLRFGWQLPDGEILPARLVEVGPAEVVVLIEHPFAGKALVIDVEVVGMR